MNGPPPDPTVARLEAARQAIATHPVPWDELRERRVLAGIEDALAGHGRRPEPLPEGRSRRTTVLAIAGAMVAVAAAVLLVLDLFVAPVQPETAVPTAMAVTDVPEPSAPSHDRAIPFEEAPVMALADGSIAELRGGARVDVGVQSGQLVRLDQRSGTVRYEVAKNPGRRFVVDASGVQVRVIGTIFTVAYAGDAHVEVSVERGLVEVASADRVAQLGAGDSLRVERIEEPDEYLIIEDDGGEELHASRQGKRPRGKTKPTTAEAGPSLSELLAESDAARAAGDLGRAATALGQLLQRFPDDPQADTARIVLGKVQRRRGRHGAAARAFASYLRRSPRGPLAEDARAESAQSWSDAGEDDKAKAAAQAYLDRYPSGAHADRMQRILDRAP